MRTKYKVSTIYALAFPLPILHNSKKPPNQFENYGSTPNENIDSHTLKYPKAVIFVLASKFFEAFAANGVRTVLALFLRDSMFLSEDSSSVILHIFNFFSQFCPIFGAVLADSYLGNSKTLFIFYIPYAVGFMGLTLTTLPYTPEIIATANLVYISLLLISIGNGSLRACITSLGGLQFQLPEQKPQLEQYFSQYYFLYTLGILLSKIFPPQARNISDCVGEYRCYMSVFTLLSLMFFTSWMIFLVGCCFYKPETPLKNNVLFRVIACIYYGMYNKFNGVNIEKGDFLSTTVNKYSETFVNDVRLFLRVIALFLPLPIYWALQTQQDSSWTFQAAQLNTTIAGFYVQPDQFKAIGPLLLMILIPVWQKGARPLLNKLGHNISPLHSITLGGFSAAFSFICAGLLQTEINKSHYQLSVLWQFPQFFYLQLAEVLLAIPGLQFAFTQAPSSMKSVITAVWFSNNAFGNLIVVIMKKIKPVHTQNAEFFIYAILMLFCILIFAYLAHNYEKNSDPAGLISQEQVIERFVYVEELEVSNLEGNYTTDII